MNIFNTTIIKKIKKNNFLPTGQTSKDWSGTDTKELYQENLLKQPKDWYYRTNKVTYTVNSDGYRTQEFSDIDWSNSIVMFGCSNTFGVGLDDKDIVSTKLQELLDIPIINMGCGGSSIIFNVHNSMILREGYPTPKGVIMFWPACDRIIEYHTTNAQQHGVWSIKPNNLADVYLKNKNNVIANAMLMVKANRLLWKDSCPYYEATWDSNTKSIIECDFIEHALMGYARDMDHPGIDSAKYIANKIAKNLKL
jgi:hypothetical protein